MDGVLVSKKWAERVNVHVTGAGDPRGRGYRGPRDEAESAEADVRPWTIWTRDAAGTLQFCVCNSTECKLATPPAGLTAGGMQQAVTGGGNVFDLVPCLSWTTIDAGGVKILVRNTLYGTPPAGSPLASATIGSIALEAWPASWSAPAHYEKDTGSTPPAWARMNLMVGTIPAPVGGALPTPQQILDRNLTMADFGLWWPW